MRSSSTPVVTLKYVGDRAKLRNTRYNKYYGFKFVKWIQICSKTMINRGNTNFGIENKRNRGFSIFHIAKFRSFILRGLHKFIRGLMFLNDFMLFYAVFNMLVK